MSRQIKIFACAAIFSVLLVLGAGAGILYVVGETVDTVAEESSPP